MNAGTLLTVFAREKKQMIKGVFGSRCDFCESFIYITETAEYWQFLVDEKLSDWNSKFNFECSMNFISLSEGLRLWRHLWCYLNVSFKQSQKL